MKKNTLRYFVSYAHRNERLAHDFIDQFEIHAGLSKKYQFKKWMDKEITIGEDWDLQIQEALEACDFGLLLLSAPFFASSYIQKVELSHFVDTAAGKSQILKPLVPVGLESFDLNGDLLGLQQLQIYRYKRAPGVDAKFYNQLQQNQRIEFVQDLLGKMTLKFDKTIEREGNNTTR